ncbi:MAG: tape measure protein [Pseudomonadota bacterium]
MALRDSVLNIVIRARDLTAGVLRRFRGELDNVDDSAQRTASGGLARLRTAVVGAVSAFATFTGIRAGLAAVFNTGNDFEKLALQLEAVMGSVEEGEQATNWIVEFTKNTPLQLQQVTEAFIRLKNFGIDPQNGSLQAIVDQNEKLGGGYERLIGITNALGQAQAKQRLQGEEILQLVERGVPVWDLLANATGRTTRELQELSSAGRLGTDVIADLIVEIGKAADGSAARNMQTLSGIVSNLRDEYTLWLAQVADQGALDALKVVLQDLRGRFQALAADGSLERFAQQTSDAISGLIGIFSSSVEFVVTYSREITALAKAFALFQVARVTASVVGFTASLVSSARQSVLFTASVGAATTAIGRLQASLLGIQAFLIGWQIGEYARERFVEVEKWSNLLVGGLLLGWEQLRRGWEITRAVFTDDTVEAAQERSDARIQQLKASIAALTDEALLAQEGMRGVAGATEDVINDLTGAAGEASNALDQTADKSEEATDRISKALEGLDVDLKTVTDGISGVGQEAIAAFNTVIEAEREAGREAQVQSRSIREAFIAAFDDIETDAGQRELLSSLRGAFEAGQISAADYTAALEAVESKVSEVAASTINWQATVQDATESVRQLGEAGEAVGPQVQAGAQQASSAAALISGALEGYTQQLLQLGPAAAGAFRELTSGAEPIAEETDRLRERLESVRTEVENIRQEGLRLQDTSGLQDYLRGVRQTAREVEIAFLEQKLAADDLFVSWENGAISADSYIARAQAAIRQGDLLDDQTLDNLQRGIDNARRSMESLNQSTARTLSNLQNELDRLQGNTEAVEQRQFEQQIRELEAQLEEARQRGDQESISNAQESLDLARQIYRVTQQQREEEARAQRARQAERNAADTAENSRRDTGTTQQQTTSSTQQVIRIEAGNRSATVTTDNPDQLLDVLSELGTTTS